MSNQVHHRLDRAALVLGLTFALEIFAATPDVSSWSTDCNLGGSTFQVRFQSASGEVGEDDMSALLLLPDQPEVPLLLTPGTFRPRAVVANQTSLCEDIGAFEVGDRVYKALAPYLLLWISVDDRPGWDQLTLVLVDVDQAKVLDRSERVAPIKDVDGRQRLEIHVAADGFRVRLERQWLYLTNADSPENSIEDWLEVWAAHGQIKNRWAE